MFSGYFPHLSVFPWQGRARVLCSICFFRLIRLQIFRKLARLSHRYVGNIEQMCYDRMDQTNEERGGRRMASERLNVTDVCDVVEFHESADGVALYGQEGRWTLSAQRGGKRNGLCHALEAGRNVSAAEGARGECRGAGGRICGGIWRAGARPSVWRSTFYVTKGRIWERTG